MSLGARYEEEKTKKMKEVKKNSKEPLISFKILVIQSFFEDRYTIIIIIGNKE